MKALSSFSDLSAWYLLRSTGCLRSASSRAAASEIGAPLMLADLSPLSPPVAVAAGAAKRSPDVSDDFAFDVSPPALAPLLFDASASTLAGSICEYSATR